MEMEISKRKLVINPDPFTQLPPEITTKILSYFTTKSAMKTTSLLSKTWLYTCTTCPILFFDQQDFNNVTHFIKFVNRVLSLRPPTHLTTFKLCWLNNVDMDCIATWLNYGLLHNVQEVHLTIAVGRFELPTKIFRCPTLKNFYLKTKASGIREFPMLELPTSTNLSCIRDLGLIWVRCSGKLLGKLVANCPLLESMSAGLWSDDLEISAPNLKRIFLVCGGHSEISMLRIFAPKLESVEFRFRHTLPTVLMGNLDFVNKVVVCCQRLGGIGNGHGNKLLNILRYVCRAKILHLTEDSLKALSTLDWSKQELPLFCNLKCLTMGTLLSEDINRILIMFLQNSPCLESLVLKNALGFQIDMTGLGDNSCIPITTDDGFISSLKDFRVHHFVGDKNEFKLVKFLLEKGCSLQSISIKCSTKLNLEKINMVSKKLLALRRASSSAEIYL